MFSFRNVVLTALSALALMSAMSSSAYAQGKDKGKELEKRFAEADIDKDGKLTAEEAKAMPLVSRNFSRIDKDKLGYVTLEQIKSMRK
jgi:Ca2+-binding EF-hand superfamily protein